MLNCISIKTSAQWKTFLWLRKDKSQREKSICEVHKDLYLKYVPKTLKTQQ